jgi:mannose-1-phosphate guanylyltransferase
MKIVLLSGGSGKRLWPISSNARSKQFLQVLSSEAGEAESMVERMWRQLKAANLHQDVYITTGTAQEEMLRSQLDSSARLIIEPERRDTFPAIALACSYLHSIEKIDVSEVICVLPIDSFVDSDYFEHLQRLEPLIRQTGANLALLGGKPTYPSEKYGYIVPSPLNGAEEDLLYRKVALFAEKPTREQARLLIKKGALWNCGVFAFELRYMLELLQRKGLPISYDHLLQQYGRLPKISFDYEVVEKAAMHRVIVHPFEGRWKDLGTWNTLTEEMEQTLLGNGYISEDSTNTHVINELDIPVIVISLSNVIVACSPQGILVSDKASSHKIKDILKN